MWTPSLSRTRELGVRGATESDPMWCGRAGGQSARALGIAERMVKAQRAQVMAELGPTNVTPFQFVLNPLTIAE